MAMAQMPADGTQSSRQGACDGTVLFPRCRIHRHKGIQPTFDGRSDMTEYCRMIDGERGAFRILDMVELDLSGQLLWHTSELDTDEAKGVTFFGFDKSDGDGSSCVSLTVADVTSDPTEPRISDITAQNLEAIAMDLRHGIEATAAANDMEILEWYGSHLSSVTAKPFLVSHYRLREPLGARREVTLRATVDNRKLVIVGWVLESHKDDLGPMIFGIINNAVVFESGSPVPIRGVFADMLRTPALLGPYTGGTGATIDSAVTITATSPRIGIGAEYAYVGLVCGRRNIDWVLTTQAMLEREGRCFDRLTVQESRGPARDFYFDISAFYGHE